MLKPTQELATFTIESLASGIIAFCIVSSQRAAIVDKGTKRKNIIERNFIAIQ